MSKTENITAPGSGNPSADADMQETQAPGIIPGRRVHLRHWQDSDSAMLYRWASDPEVGPRAGWPPHKTEEESLSVIRNILRNDTNWAVVLNGSRLLIGAMGYGPSCECGIPTRGGEPIVGYWIARPYWNQGYCTEALELMIGWIREHTKIQSLASGHFIDNPASGKVMEKCGFAPTGLTCTSSMLQTRDTRPIRVLRLELGGGNGVS